MSCNSDLMRMKFIFSPTRVKDPGGADPNSDSTLEKKNRVRSDRPEKPDPDLIR